MGWGGNGVPETQGCVASVLGARVNVVQLQTTNATNEGQLRGVSHLFVVDVEVLGLAPALAHDLLEREHHLPRAR